MKKLRNIVVLGKSKKFMSILNSIFPDSNKKFYSWRLLNQQKFKKKNKIDLIFLSGYDYSTSIKSFNNYSNLNINNPLNFVKKYSSKKTIIFYINTDDNVKKFQMIKSYTFSRYEYAKKELAYQLNKNFKNLRILNLPVITDSKGNPQIYGGPIVNFIFSFLVKKNFVNSIKISLIKKKILQKLRSSKKEKIKKIKPVLITVPRTHFLDRVVRMF